MHRSTLGGNGDCETVEYVLVAQLGADLNKGAHVFWLAQVAERCNAENGNVRESDMGMARNRLSLAL